MRPPFYGLLLVHLLAIAAPAASAQDGLPAPPRIVADTSFGEVNYDLELLATDSTAISLSEYRGRVLFINFWASWCAPCLREMPSIDALRRRVDEDDIAVLMVSVDDELTDVRTFAARHEVESPVFLRAWRREEPPFRSALLPRTYVVSRHGKVVYEHTGAADWDTADIADDLEELARE